jgi:hypothetical protein
MRPSTPLVAAVVVLSLAVVFLLWQRGNGQQLGAPSQPTAGAATGSSGKIAAGQPAGDRDAGVDARESANQDPSKMPIEAMLASPVPSAGSPGALERSLIDFQHKALTAHASRLTRSPKFDDYAAKLQSDADADAVKRMRDYRELFDETLAALPGAKSVNRLACGVKMCMASIVADKEWSDFFNWQVSLHDMSDLPMQASATDSVNLPGGGVEYRMIFTTSREFNAIQGDASHP